MPKNNNICNFPILSNKYEKEKKNVKKMIGYLQEKLKKHGKGMKKASSRVLLPKNF